MSWLSSLFKKKKKKRPTTTGGTPTSPPVVNPPTTGNTSQVPVGDYLTSADYMPYLREQAITFYAAGLRPGALVHVFFDGAYCSDIVIPGTIANTELVASTISGADQIILTATTVTERQLLSQANQALTVANNGTVAGALHIPTNTFFVGDRDLIIADVTQFNSIDTASTFAKQTFRAYNFDPRGNATRTPVVSPGSSDGVTTTQNPSGRPTVITTSNNSANIEPSSITLYSAVNYGGNSTTFTSSYGALTQHSANGISNWNDQAKSVKITGNTAWTLWRHINYTGENMTITANTADIEWLQLSSFAPARTLGLLGGRVRRFIDPIAETFTIPFELVDSKEGVYISEIDLFFQRKDATRGVTVELRQTVNGYPSSELIPFGTKWLPSSLINTSTTGATATTFTFDGPVYLPSGTEFAFVVIPDGNSPEYLIFTAVGGQSDLATGTVVRQDWGNGVMFQSTNNSAWTAVQNEDIKFVMRYANFTQTSGHASFQNKSYEFLTLSTSNGTFLSGEKVFKITANLTGNITTLTTNLNVSGLGTLFQSELSVGSFMTIPDVNISPTAFDLVKIATITSNTALTLERLPRYSVTNTNHYSKPVFGVVDQYNSNAAELVLVDSIADSTAFMFANTNEIRGVLSNANATINVVSNKLISYFQPLMGRLQLNGAALEMDYRAANTTHGIQAAVPAKFNDSNYMLDYEAIVASRSNEIVAGANVPVKSFRANIVFSTTNDVVSPVIDRQNMSILCYRNFISNTTTGEYTNYGSANSKHITARVTLTANQEAEDIKVYLTAYRPANTDIEVYAKIQNAADQEPFEEKYWSKLNNVTPTGLVSDSSDQEDFIDMEYTFRTDPEVYDAANGVATVNTTSPNITGVSTVWELGTGNSALTSNDVIKIVNINNPEQFDIQRVITVVSNTAVVLGSNISFSAAGAKIYKLQYPYASFLWTSNDGVVRYFGRNGGAFDGYRTFQLKVVLLADDTSLVPTISDLRAIALSV